MYAKKLLYAKVTNKEYYGKRAKIYIDKNKWILYNKYDIRFLKCI